MKKLLLGAFLAVATVASSLGQATINIANYENSNPSSSATSGGLFWAYNWISTVLMEDPPYPSMNVQLLGGPNAGALSHVATINDGSFAYSGLSGAYLDLNGTEFTVPGVALNATGFFKIRAWLGSDLDWNSAMLHDVSRGESSIFTNPTGGGLTPTPTLTGMSAVVLTVPEPGTLALAGLGVAALVALRRRR